jgi:hypothetical protein
MKRRFFILCNSKPVSDKLAERIMSSIDYFGNIRFTEMLTDIGMWYIHSFLLNEEEHLSLLFLICLEVGRDNKDCDIELMGKKEALGYLKNTQLKIL